MPDTVSNGTVAGGGGGGSNSSDFVGLPDVLS